jgi:adenosine deaminase
MGVFNSPLSNEFFVAAQTFGLTPSELAAVSHGALAHAFVDDSKKTELHARWTREITALLDNCAGVNQTMLREGR